MREKRFSFRRLTAGLLFVIFAADSGSAQTILAGYYAAWHSVLLPYNKVHYADLSHLNVAFSYPNANGTLSYDVGIPFTELVQTAHLAGKRVLIALGGAGGSGNFAAATADSTVRRIFINNIVDFLSMNDYDGVDIDWETPANATETQHLTLFMQEMRAKFNQVQSRWLITMAVPPTNWGGQHFDFPNLLGSVDWFNVMCYDFYGSWSGFAGHNSPLYQSLADPTYAGSDSTSVAYIVSRGVSKAKLVLGIPFYSVRFNSKGLYQSLTNSLTSNPYYPDIVNYLSSGWSYQWDEASKVPYLLNADSTQFVTFEDTVSIRLKAEFAVRQQLGGLMCWELAQDVMADGSQPLLAVMAKVLGGVTYAEGEQNVPEKFVLYENYPNPFNPATTIRFDLPESAKVRLGVNNLLGQTVASVDLGILAAGTHRHVVDLSHEPSGVYFYRIRAERANEATVMIAKKMVLVK